MRDRSPSSRVPRWLVLPLLGLPLLGGLASCGLLRKAAETPGRVATAVIPGSESKAPDPEALLSDLFRLSDLILFRVNEASREFDSAVGTPEAELQAAEWRLSAHRWILQIATSPNSAAALLDLMVVTTTSRWLLEDHYIPEVWGEAARPMLLAYEGTEADGWRLVERHLEVENAKNARKVLELWRGEHPHIEREMLLAFPNFSSLAAGQGAASGGSGNLLGIVGLDPLSGLEPVARQIAEARLLGLRGLFFVQRAPQLVSAEVELRLLRARRAPEVRQVLEDTERVTTTLEQLAATAERLPAQLSAEREAALNQIGAELDAQRAGLLADLQAAQAPLQELLSQAQGTLDSGKAMSAELTTTLRTLDAFVGRFDEPEAEPGAAPAAPAATPEPPGKPFDIAEYGLAAERIGVAAGELNALVAALDQRMPEVQRLLDETATRGERTVDHVVLRVLQVGLALILAAALCAWIVRRAGRA